MRLPGLAWRALRARPLRTTLAIVGVAMGVGMVAGATIAGEAADEAVRSVGAEVLGRADLRLRAFNDSGFTPRTLQAVRSLAGVQSAAPIAERRMQVSTLGGNSGQVFALLVLGIEPDVDAQIRTLELAAGRVLDSSDAPEALVTADLASRRGLEIGDDLRLTGRDPDAGPMRIVGLLEPAGLAALEHGELMITGRAALDASFATPAPVRYLDVDLAGGDDAAGHRAALLAAIGEPYIVETAADSAARLEAAQAAFASIGFLLGLVAMVVAAFLVGNALAITVGERTREIGLLRAAGATRGQALGLVMRQGLWIGLAGTALGLVLGIGLAAVVIAMLRATRAVLAEGLPIPPGGMLLAAALGIGVCLAATVLPAVGAASIAPLAAMRPLRNVGDALPSRLRWLLLAELALIALGVIAYPRGATGVPLVPLLASLGLLLGGAVAAAFVLEPLGRLIGRPFEWFFGAQGLLGRANLARDRTRTGLTVGALLIALAAVVALGTLAQSARGAAERWVDSILPGGHAVRLVAPVDTEVVRPTLESTVGLAAASPVVELPAVIRSEGNLEVSVAGIDPVIYEAAGALLIRDAGRSDAFDALRGGGAALVPAALASRQGLGVGDIVEIGEPGRDAHPFRIAGLLDYPLPARSPDGAILISAADSRELFGATAAALWVMVPQDDVPPSVFRGAVRETAALVAGEAIDAPQLAAELSRSLDRLMSLFDVLAAIAVVIAALGIVNTLSMGVSERVREIAILRSQGMTAPQVQAMVVSEAAIMGVIGALLGIGIGLLVAWVLVGADARQFGAGVTLPWGLLIAVLFGGTGVAVISAIYPARVAARLPMLHSLKHFE